MSLASRSFKRKKCAKKFANKVKGDIKYLSDESDEEIYTVSYDTENNMCIRCKKRQCNNLSDFCISCQNVNRYHKLHPESSKKYSSRTLHINKLLKDETLSQSDIARIVGVSRQWVSEHLKKNLEREYKILEQENQNEKRKTL